MKEKSIIVGINWEQNSTACLMIDGRIVGAISEERFTRVKMMKLIQKKRLSIY